MQEVWGTGAFERRTYHQKPPNGSKGKDHILKKMESYTDIDVIGWSVMRSTLGNQQEHLLRGSKNI